MATLLASRTAHSNCALLLDGECCGCRRSYNQPLPVAEDYTKEPPPAPAHLQLTLLNVPPAIDATATLPRPQHVVLNHTYCQRASHQVGLAAAQCASLDRLPRHAGFKTQRLHLQCPLLVG